MRQFLAYLFCISIFLQSIVGQFMFYDSSTDSFYASISSFSSFSHPEGLSKLNGTHEKAICPDETEINNELPTIGRDLVAEHLFSPSNCPESGHSFVFFSFLFLGHCFDLFVIEEKISNFVHFYSSFFRNIEIGLPSTKIIYPYHNFY